MTTAPLLSVENLQTHFITFDGVAKAVDDVSFRMERGETLGIVGESGCGKSVTALTIMRLIKEPPGRIAGGRILFKEQDLLTLRPAEMRHIRGNRISMIFQEPMTSLNPVYTVGDQIAEMFVFHRHMSPRTELGASGRNAPERPDAQPGEARPRVSSPAFGRHAPTGHDRHGLGL